MILIFDIGNTNIHIGYYKNDKLIQDRNWRTENGFNNKLLKYLTHDKAIEGVGIASVVPSLDRKLYRFFLKKYSVKAFFVNAKIRMPVKIAYDNIGSDRVANINGAYIRYKSDLIIFSFGTAVTGDVVLKNGIHVGGLIIPGIDTQIWSLKQKTALIRNIYLQKSPPLLGKSTNGCVQTGIINGIKFSVEGFITKIKETYKRDFKVIVTGGWAKRFSSLISVIDRYDNDLTFFGIYQLYRQNV
ncbi:MAG: type III pantothenate kinase [candidate division WOR-3 bacterium]